MAVAFQDYYEALGVPRDASAEDIRRAYRTLARQYHPDVNKEPGAEDRFKQISEAYEVLRDEDKRRRYDRLGANWRRGQDVSGAPGFEEAFRNGGGGAGGGGFRDVRVDFGGADFGDSGFSDLFESLFSRGSRPGAGGSGAGNFSMQGSDQEAVLELSLEEAARGGRRQVSFADGRSFEVEIPRGVRDGQVIRLAGQGSAGVGGAASGDLLLRVRLRPHPRFRVEGRDLYVDLPIAPWEGALGATVPVPTLEGEARVTVPAGSSTGRRLRLRGQGLPAGEGATPGNLYAVLQIHVPKRLTRAERELFEELQKTSKFDPRKGR
jgi:curved DNA-binding protein